MIVPEGGFDVATGSRHGAEPFLEAFDVSDITSGFADRVITMAAGDDNLYVNLGNRAVMKLPAGGKPTMLAVGPLPPNQRTEPPRNAQRIAGLPPVAHGGRARRLALRAEPRAGLPLRRQVVRARQHAGARTTRRTSPSTARTGSTSPIPATAACSASAATARPSRCSAPPRRRAAGPAGSTSRRRSIPPTATPSRRSRSTPRATCSSATSGLPRILALTTNGRFGVVAGTGVAGTGLGDGRAVSAQIGDVTNLAVGPDDDLYVGEFYRALRINDPVSGLGEKPARRRPRPAQRLPGARQLGRRDAPEPAGHGQRTRRRSTSC